MQKKVTVMINMVMLNWTGMLCTIELDEIIFLLKTPFTPKFIFFPLLINSLKGRTSIK